MGVVRRFFLGSADVEKFASRLGRGFALSAGLNHARRLDLFVEVNLLTVALPHNAFYIKSAAVGVLLVDHLLCSRAISSSTTSSVMRPPSAKVLMRVMLAFKSRKFAKNAADKPENPSAEFKRAKPYAVKTSFLAIAAQTLAAGHSHAGPTGGVIAGDAGNIESTGSTARINQDSH